MLLLTAWATAATSSAQASKTPAARCAVQAHTRLVTQSAQVRVTATTVAFSSDHGQIYVNRQWRYCLRRRGSGRFSVLVDAAQYGGGLGNTVDVGPLVVSGGYVAYATETTAYAGRYGNGPEGVLTVWDLLTSSRRHVKVAPGPSGCPGEYSQSSICTVGPTRYYCRVPYCSGSPVLLLTSDGIAAWHAEQKCLSPGGMLAQRYWLPCAWGIQALDERTGWTGTLDTMTFSQHRYPPDPFTNLRIYECNAGCSPHDPAVLAWSQSGLPRSAFIG